MTVREVLGAGRRCILDIEAQVRDHTLSPPAACGRTVRVRRESDK